MDKEYLENYEARENELNENLLVKVLAQGLTEDDILTLKSRFRKINEPIVLCDTAVHATDGEKVWSQIPFAGTLVIPLLNTPKDKLLHSNGFEVSDIADLVRIAKETGKVQFVLGTYPSNFAGLDHFDPIFQELNPPTLPSIPVDRFTDTKLIDRWRTEFGSLINISYGKWLRDYLFNHDYDKQYLSTVLTRHMNTFLQLKSLKIDKITESISNLLVDEPFKAATAMEAYTFFLGNMFNVYRINRNASISKLQLYQEVTEGKMESTTFPVEIGRYLMKKLTLYPPSYTACMDIIGHYKENDLYKILESLDTGVETRSEDAVISNSRELEMVLDNMWKDADRITSLKKYVRHAISFSLGIVGFGVSSWLGAGLAGFLAGLGFEVLDQKLESDDISVSEKIAKLVHKDYLVNIYNFKEKYSHTKLTS